MVFYLKDDANIMANLLRMGYKMLNKSCPVCNNPIFQDKNNRMFCPICNREVIITNNENYRPKNKIDEGNRFSKISNNHDILLSLREITYNKIKILYELLSTEDKMDIIKKYTTIILKLLKIIRYIELIIQDYKKL